MDKEILIAVIGAAATVLAAVIGVMAMRRRGAAHDAPRGGMTPPVRPRETASVGHGPAQHRSQIRQALEALLHRTHDDAFVILEEPRSSKFVQFANDAGGLLLDLPFSPLSHVELSRAKAFFERRGVAPSAASEIETFQMELGADVARAVDLALAVFRDIYGFEDELEIIVNEN